MIENPLSYQLRMPVPLAGAEQKQFNAQVVAKLQEIHQTFNGLVTSPSPAGALHRMATVGTQNAQLPTDKLILCDATAGSFYVHLLASAAAAGVSCTFKRVESSANTVSILAMWPTDSVEGAASIMLSALDTVTLYSDGAGHWYAV